jgi:hypothetical protein
VRRAIILLAAAAAVATWSLAAPTLACDGHKAEAAAVVAKAEEAKPAVTAASTGCDHAAKAAAVAAGAAVMEDGQPAVVKASAEGEGKGGCAKAKGCAKKGATATAATVAKAEEPKTEEAKTK